MEKPFISSQVGVTKSGVPVYLNYFPFEGGIVVTDTQKFSNPEDLFDAYAIFEALAVGELRDKGSGNWHTAYADLAVTYLKKFNEVVFEEIKQKNAIKTSIDIANHGRRLYLRGIKTFK